MLSSKLSPKEMRKESRRLIKNLSRRIARIEELGNTAPQTAVIKYRDLEKNIPKNLTQLTDEDLTTLYRDLRYINDLKSSTVKGALSSQENLDTLSEQLQLEGKYSTLRELFDALSPTVRDALWEIYGDFYEDTSGTGEKFKYEIFGTSIDYVYGGDDVEKTIHDIIKEYRNVYKELGSNATDETVKVLFTQKLQSLRK